jgi:hypothetical protein
MLLVLGLFLGWGLASFRPAPIRASSGDRSGESIVTTGPILIRYDEGNKVQIPLEALYILDYKAGRLLGTVPALHTTVKSSNYLGRIAERDLVADFKIDLDNGPKPHFLMTTGSLGAYNGGWAPLYVYETSTNQIAVYRILQQTVGTKDNTSLELLEVRALARSSEPAPRR